MKAVRSFLLATLMAVVSVSSAEATILSVSGPNSLRGGVAAIIAPPPDLTDDGAFNLAQQGFDEVQNFVLNSDLSVDGGVIASGTVVSSHLIFLNNMPNVNTLNEHIGVQWTFSGIVLGVMSDIDGALEAASSSFLGAPGTIYPNAPFDSRGMEVDDSYLFGGAVLTVNSRIRQPGDWIRVITTGSSDTGIPEPATAALLACGALGWLGASRRRAA